VRIVRPVREVPEHDDEQVKALTEQELARVVAETPEEWRLLIELLSHGGLRISEALPLRWPDPTFLDAVTGGSALAARPAENDRETGEGEAAVSA
jgi:integrase